MVTASLSRLVVADLVTAGGTVAVVLTQRLLPFVLCLAIRPRGAPVIRRVMWASAWAASAAAGWWCGATISLALVAAASAYYVALGLCIHPLSAWMAAGLVTRSGALALLFFFCLLLPGLASSEAGLNTFLFLGWDLAMSGYSYVVETSRRGAVRPPLGDCLFFLLVNPTVVYTARGREVPGPIAIAGTSRVLGGIGLLLLNVAVLRSLAAWLHAAKPLASLPAGVALGATAFAFARFIEIYAAHSGLASLQIGLMRQVGWVVPERYEYPMLAVSPIDFWRRWNTYVRLWLEAYVFWPLARRIARKTRRPSGMAAAAAVTLVASGALHAALVFAGRQSFQGVPFGMYVAAGILVAAWQLALVGRTKLLRRFGLDRAPGAEAATRVFGRFVLVVAVVGAAMAWG
jgi:hypothetical protein